MDETSKLGRSIRKRWRDLAAKPWLRGLNEFIFDCSLHGLGILNFGDDRISGEKHFVEQLLPRFLGANKKPVVVDCGANVGDYTRMILAAHPDASIWAFEPNPRTYEKLIAGITQPNVETVNQGLGSSESTLKLFDRQDKQGSSGHGSLYREVIEEIHATDSVEMEISVTTLDQFASENEIDSINLLKIDTEGHEMEVLKGAAGLLNAGKIDLIHLEFNEMNVVSRVFFRDIAKELSCYSPYRFLPSGVIPLGDRPLKTEIFAYQNIAFVHKKFAADSAMRPAA